ncbi:MAG: SigB/SigF/SigG family RNA polymerase sigma factor [Oscillospiraceae bacterium]|nr:SigB/SigF/SigG family RNA polymerase sigma factor [Oscillospiraceae bacterium]MDY3258604.1 SigB/SigF/SigG family RNA polymerase sigma factor [Ruminococcus callidus]
MSYSKVNISGISTSQLKTMKEAEKISLLEEYKKTGSIETRNKLIQGNLRLVLSVIQKYSGRGQDADDLFQIGVIGLIKAIENFDLTKEVRFSTYCVPMINGELRRYLRDFNPVKISRTYKDTAYKALQAKEKFIADNKREPTIEEIAELTGLKKEDIVVSLESMCEPVSLYEPVFSDAGDTVCVMDQIGDKSSAESWIRNISFKEAMNSLDRREKNIVFLRFYRGKTQMEVAEEIGISQAQVSRLEKGAVSKIKTAVEM